MGYGWSLVFDPTQAHGSWGLSQSGVVRAASSQIHVLTEMYATHLFSLNWIHLQYFGNIVAKVKAPFISYLTIGFNELGIRLN